MATLTPQVPSLSGMNPTYAAASAGGDRVAPGDTTFLHVKNGSASAVTVTLTAAGAIRGQVAASPAISIPASGERMIGPLSADLLASPTDGLVPIGYSASASVTVAAIRI